jgi:phage repressor protein C with HTH and peptisase S24 domain
LRKIATLFQVDISWLCGSAEDFQPDARPSIPHYDIQASAGSGESELVPSQGRYVGFDNEWLARFVPAGARLGILDVNGDSMAPTLRSGDSIIVNMNADHIETAMAEGGIFVFSIHGSFKVKRLQPLATGDLRIISDNTNYETETVSADILAEAVHIQAVVIKRIGDP